MFNHARPAALVSALVAVLLFAGGCTDTGPELGAVTGVVTLDGQPLASAEVTFQPDDGSPSSDITDAAGRYELMYTPDKPGAMLGRHTVIISTRRYETDAEGNEIEIPEQVPARYNTESELSAVVQAGPNEHNFRLETAEGEAQPPEEPEAPAPKEKPDEKPTPSEPE